MGLFWFLSLSFLTAFLKMKKRKEKLTSPSAVNYAVLICRKTAKKKNTTIEEKKKDIIAKKRNSTSTSFFYCFQTT